MTVRTGTVIGTTRSNHRARLPIIAAVSMLFLVAVDSLRHIGLGPMTVQGLLTIFAAIGIVVLLPSILLQGAHGARSTRSWRARPQSPLPNSLWLFIAWVAVRLVTTPLTSDGIQNVAVYLALIGTIALTAAQSDNCTADRILTSFRRNGWIIAIVYTVSLLFSGLGNSSIYGARSFALSALVVMSVTIPDAERRRSGVWLSLILACLITASESRTATLTAALMLVALAVRARRGRRVGSSLAIGLLLFLAAWWLVNFYSPIKSRFDNPGDNAVIAGIHVNTSGRSVLWELTWKDSLNNLWFGQGPGSANEFISGMFPAVGHPHNDYLRIFHDFGIVGVALWLFGFAALLIGALGRARKSRDGREWRVHISAALALSAVAVGMITDNVIVYIFVAMPLGVLVGASRGYRPEEGPSRETHDVSRSPVVLQPSLGDLGRESNGS